MHQKWLHEIVTSALLQLKSSLKTAHYVYIEYCTSPVSLSPQAPF